MTWTRQLATATGLPLLYHQTHADGPSHPAWRSYRLAALDFMSLLPACPLVAGCRYYETLHILWLMPDAYRTAATVGLSGGWGLFELKAESSVTGFLTLHQRR